MSCLLTSFNLCVVLLASVQCVFCAIGDDRGSGTSIWPGFKRDGGDNIFKLFKTPLDSLNALMTNISINRAQIISIVRSVEGYPYSCGDSLDLMFENVSPWALEMLDASSKVASGLLKGNLMDLGSFDECLAVVADVPAPGQSFFGQHCLINTSIHFQMEGQTPFPLPSGALKTLGGSVPYTFSLCLPSTCSPLTIQTALSTVASYINSELKLYNSSVGLNVKDSDCHTNDRPSLGTMEVIGIVITLGIIVLAVVSTITDLTLSYRNKQDGESLDVPERLKTLVAFSLYTNGRNLLKTEPSEGTIRALHGLKFISIAWVVVGHRVRFSAAKAPLVNLLTLADVMKRWSSMIVLNATLSVDVFFVISGILNTYMYMSAKVKSPLSHFGVYVHRYVRLTPAYAVMMLVTGTWLYRAGSGPLWDRLVGEASDSCSRNWWSGLLYVNNYYHPDDYCMMQSWYLAVDMQLFWLSPLVLYPLKRWPTAGLSVLITLIVPSIVIPFLVAYIYEIKTPIPISFDAASARNEMAELYLPTHTKTVSYVIGMLAGYFLYLIKDGKISFRPSMVRCAVLWASSALAMGWALFGGHSLFQLDSTYDRWHSSLYIAFYRFFWSAGVAWVVLASATGYGGAIGRFLSWRAFAPLGRLTYCIYLTHVAVILYGVGSLRQPQYFSYYDTLMKSIGELVISTFIAALLSLTVEAPIMRLEKIFLKNGRFEIFLKEARRRYFVVTESSDHQSLTSGTQL